MNLFITLYNEKDPDRLGELMECYTKNLANRHIDQIYILNEGLDLQHYYQRPMIRRTMYSDLYNYINAVTTRDQVNIIANSDIYFDETIELAERIKKDECYALCRQDMPVNYWGGSQDVWIFRGFISEYLEGDFPIGFPGCDNRLGFMLDKAGYKTLNPCEQIKCWHNHKEQKEGNWYHSKDAALLDIAQYNGAVEYDEGRGVPVVKPPYRIVIPCEI